MRGRSNNFVSFRERHPEVASQWHPALNACTPDEVPHGSSYLAWWVCADHGPFRQRVSKRSAGQGCPTCARLRRGAARRRPQPGQSLADLYPALAAEWAPSNSMSPYDLRPNSHMVVTWLCPVAQHPNYAKSPNTRLSMASGCPPCGFKARGEFHRRPMAGHSLADRQPHLIAEWDQANSLSPDQVKDRSEYEAWWKCIACGHRWKAPVKRRTYGAGCPVCGIRRRAETQRRPDPGHSLAELFPLIASQWDPVRNAPLTALDVSPRSSQTAFWRCDQADDHFWPTRVAERTGGGNRAGTGCPFCPTAQRPRASSTNNLSLSEKLMADFDRERNTVDPTTVTTSARTIVHWRCPHCDHRWEQSVNQRSQCDGCPSCNPVHRSQREIRIEAELRSVLAPSTRLGSGRSVRCSSSTHQCDIVLEHLEVIVEYDGSYWHRGKERRDLAKSRSLAHEGWHVIRIREIPLKPLGPHDIRVSSDDPIKVVVDATLSMIQLLTGVATPALDDYLTQPETVNQDQAEREIARLRRERASRRVP